MTDSPRDLQAEDLYRRLWFMWPEGMTITDLLDDADGCAEAADALVASGRAENCRRQSDNWRIVRARMAT